MSTRATVHFEDTTGTAHAIVYRHSDGYPDSEAGVLADLEQFFAAVQAAVADTRFGDPSYLAARFVVWQSQDIRRNLDEWREAADLERSKGELDFLGVGVVIRDPGDIEYRYHVRCNGEIPRITYDTIY